LARIYDEKGFFNINDIFSKIIEKMIRRHPHVFGEKHIDSANDVKDQWHQIKLKETDKDEDGSLLDSVPVSLPALTRAYRVSERASTSGFDWDDVSGVMKKLDEELAEFKTEISKDEDRGVEIEYGDVLFTLVNVARFLNIHPETALRSSIKKFEKRFQNLEKEVSNRGQTLETIPQAEKDLIWDRNKTKSD
jgi:tetrapyrrole methylase family protein/MazG family protein